MNGRSAATPSTSLVDGGLRQVAGHLTALFRRAIQAANAEMDAIIQSGEQDTQRIEHQLDDMLSLCCDPDMLLVFKRLCRYYYGIDLVAAAEYVNAYLEMWNTPDEVDSEEGAA